VHTGRGERDRGGDQLSDAPFGERYINTVNVLIGDIGQELTLP
jgi:hypothetical protein